MDPKDAAETKPETTPEKSPEEIAKEARESEARHKGWKPKEEFEHEGTEWIDADEFLKRAPLFEEKKKLKKEVRELKKTVHDLIGHHNKVSETAYNRAIQDLKKERKEAIEIGDSETVEKLDQQIEDTKEELTKVKKSDNQIAPELAEWIDNNQWFLEHPELNAFARAYHDSILRMNPPRSAEDMDDSLRQVTQMVKKTFPDKFPSEKRKNPPAVEGGHSGNGPKKYTFKDLNSAQQEACRRFVRQGIMKEDDYINELIQIGELGGTK